MHLPPVPIHPTYSLSRLSPHMAAPSALMLPKQVRMITNGRPLDDVMADLREKSGRAGGRG